MRRGRGADEADPAAAAAAQHLDDGLGVGGLRVVRRGECRRGDQLAHPGVARIIARQRTAAPRRPVIHHRHEIVGVENDGARIAGRDVGEPADGAAVEIARALRHQGVDPALAQVGTHQRPAPFQLGTGDRK
jgi:hypothetical protein